MFLAPVSCRRQTSVLVTPASLQSTMGLQSLVSLVEMGALGCAWRNGAPLRSGQHPATVARSKTHFPALLRGLRAPAALLLISLAVVTCCASTPVRALVSMALVRVEGRRLTQESGSRNKTLPSASLPRRKPATALLCLPPTSPLCKVTPTTVLICCSRACSASS